MKERRGVPGLVGPSVRADCGVCVGPDGWTRLAWATSGRITRGSGWAGRDWPGPPAGESRVGPDGWTRLAWATSGRITRGPRMAGLDWPGPPADESRVAPHGRTRLALGHRRTNHAWLRTAGRDWPGPPVGESRVGPDGRARLAWVTKWSEVTKWSNFRKKQRETLSLTGRCIQVQNGDWSGSPSGRRGGRWTVVTLIGGVVWRVEGSGQAG